LKRLLIGMVLVILLTGCTHSTLIPLFSGNCVDRAVQIRQHLKEDGYEAEIVIGTGRLHGKKVGHAWIKYRKPGNSEWIRYTNWIAKREDIL